MKKQMSITVPEAVYRMLKKYPNMSARIAELVIQSEMQDTDKKKYYEAKL